VIRLPRSAVGGAPSPSPRPAAWASSFLGYHRAPRLWHAACTGLALSGCLIVKGPYSIRRNSPPEEFMVNPRARIVLDLEVQAVLVGFRDDDAQPLFFTWVLDGRQADAADVSTFVDTSDPFLYYSTFRARREALAEVETVQVFVTDGADAARVTWQVEVP
jgi:hypothetical protein